MEGRDRSARETPKPSPRPGRALPRTPEPRSPVPRQLPRIRTRDVSCPGRSATTLRPPQDRTWSRFHSGCRETHPMYMDWSTVKTGKKSAGIPFPGKVPRCGKARSMTSFKEAEEQSVMQYLDNNQKFLEQYVVERVPVDVIQKWLANKLKRNTVLSAPSTSKASAYTEPSWRRTSLPMDQHFGNLLEVLEIDCSEHAVLRALAGYITSTIGVDAFRVYKTFPNHPTFVQFFVYSYEAATNVPKTSLVRVDPNNVGMVLDVARSRACRRLTRSQHPSGFPDTPIMLFKSLNMNVKVANHVMYQPVFGKGGGAAYVIEMWRIRDEFQEIDEEISSNFVVLASLTLHSCNLYVEKTKERNSTDYLLTVARSLFEEMISLDLLIKSILRLAQHLVNADRASLFLIDYRNYELVSTVFDLKYSGTVQDEVERKEIRMPINRGIAGHVAQSGQSLNIPDAYLDYRFNRDVDEATGYKTISILCMPVKLAGRIIGVVQMVNKRDQDTFTRDDEISFEALSTFFGIALHHARLYDRILRKEQKYKVALEVLSYHNTCRETDVMTMLSDQSPIDANLNNFFLDPYKFDEYEKCKCVIKMFGDLFNFSNFDISTLTRFVLTVKKNYRKVPYHNFDHGWTVAHSMYCILKNDFRKRFNYKMRLALFVACLCHDLDHRGYTNKYMSEIASPLAAMYTTSTLEHHHFNITVTILQQEGHNIFSHVTSEEYKEILGYIKHCILATDLAMFFPNINKLNKLYSVQPIKFNWYNEGHRELGMAISMTAADLSASAKPWEIQIKTVKIIFEEFYDQGDKERASGKTPIPMMDRNKPYEQPSSQVGFLSQICIPCYSILYKMIPQTKAMYVMASKNLEKWTSRAKRIDRNRDKFTGAVAVVVQKPAPKTTPKSVSTTPESARDSCGTLVGGMTRDSSSTWEPDDDSEDRSFRTGPSVRSDIWRNIDRE